MDISEKIKSLRKLHGWTQNQLGDFLNVSYMTVRRWETKKSSPDLNFIHSLAKLFNVSVRSLTDEGISIDDMFKEEPPVEQSSLPINNIDNNGNERLATLSLGGDKNVTVPATPEGYAFLERIYAMSVGRAVPA